MQTWQTVVALVVLVALLYVAFIIGAVFVRIMLGLIAIVIVVWLVRSFIIRPRRP
jgi:hypothetical protein